MIPLFMDSGLDVTAHWDSDDIEAEQERLYVEWVAKGKSINVSPDRVADATIRVFNLREQVVASARRILASQGVSMPPEMRADLEQLLKAEASVREAA